MARGRFPACIYPEPDYDAPSDIDAEILKRPYVEPYWVLALRWRVRFKYFTHSYKIWALYWICLSRVTTWLQSYEVTGWQPQPIWWKAAHQVFEELTMVLNISFTEGSMPLLLMLLQLVRAVRWQPWLSYPNSYHEIGMDVFIATGFSSSQFTRIKLRTLTMRFLSWNYHNWSKAPLWRTWSK